MDLGTCVHRINYINTQLHHSPRDTLVRVFSLPLLKSFCFVYTFIISIGAKKLWSISSVFTLFFLIPYSTIVKFQKVPEKWMGLSLPPNRWPYPPIQHHSTHSVDKNWIWRLHLLGLDEGTSKQVWSPQPHQDENSGSDNAYPTPTLTKKAFQSCISNSTARTQPSSHSLKSWL